MIRKQRFWFFALILSFVSFGGLSQKLIKGIVVDSVSLDGLPGVHIRIKDTNHAAVSDSNGIFTVLVKKTDTILFSFIGYHNALLPVNTEDELMFVRMRDNSIMLNEIVVRSSFFDQEFIATPKLESPALRSIQPLRAGEGGINFAYFTKEEKEKRKLVKVLEELDHARVYIDIVNDPGLKSEILSRYDVSEAKYFELLAYFNEHNTAVMHSGNPEIILKALNTYFRSSLKAR